jgi:hypothetical protein
MASSTTKTKQAQQRGLTLAWEIGIVLIIKFALLWLLWDLFFSHPQAKHMHLPESQVTQHLLSSSSNPKPVSTKHD